MVILVDKFFLALNLILKIFDTLDEGLVFDLQFQVITFHIVLGLEAILKDLHTLGLRGIFELHLNVLIDDFLRAQELLLEILDTIIEGFTSNLQIQVFKLHILLGLKLII